MVDSAPAAVELSGPADVQKDGLIGWIERRPQAAFGWFLALHFAVWTTLPTLLYANLPLDLIEAVTYGREWPLGSDKLPPLPWWLVEILYRSFGVDGAYYALAQAVVVIAFALVFVTARRMVGATGALVGVLIIDGMHYFQYTAVKFNHDVIQLPFWALAGYSFHAALRRGRLGHWALLGVAFGGALWAKYFVVVLAAPYALFLLFDREARRALATPGPWLALGLALLIALPHVIWLFQNDFIPFTYAEHRAAPVRGWFDHVVHPAFFAVSQAFFLLPTCFIAAALLWPRQKRRGEIAADAFDRRIVTMLAFGPALATIALGIASGRGAIAMWGYPLWLFLGLWIVMTVRPLFDRDRIARVGAAWAAVFTLFALVFLINYTVLPRFDHRYYAEFYPGDKLGQILTQRFHAATGKPLRYVIGSMWDGGNLAHYSPDQPHVLIDGEPARAPWVDMADLRKDGAIVVWTQSDPKVVPPQFAAVAPGAEVGAPFDLPMRRGSGAVHVGWAIVKPQA
ncbi:MAG TPA: glycosyltransferase family 39 protein [Xanthobacteraceae bacterium]|jgi:4-amino-4-deoxy-L-arabinose transferase-like glycosyltransferase|nr:glycosyltransferase family 39 protein [Xanthobacteraceae bacterium]